MTSYLRTFSSSWVGGHTCKVFTSICSAIPEKNFEGLRKKKIYIYIYGCQIVWPMTSFFFLFSVDEFILVWPSKMFILIGYSVLHMQLWCYNEDTSDVILKNRTYYPCGVLAICQVSIFPLVGFQRSRPKVFLFFQHDCHTMWPMMS